MRAIGAAVVCLLTIGLIYVLNNPLGQTPAIGKLLDPVNGCWANAESVNKDFNSNLKLLALKQSVTVWLDDRMVPHIHANNTHDLYYVQGYLHAYFRLWQMDMQARASAGRISEVVGARALKYDRTQRRKGMVYGAENSLKTIEADPRSKEMLDAYTAGVNKYIATLEYKTFPLEYKLMGFAPEEWTNLKSALLMKYMADDLTGYTEDIPLTMLREVLSTEDFNALYPERIQGSTPVIPTGTAFEKASLPTSPIPLGNIWGRLRSMDFTQEKQDGKGSNNWAVSGTRTQSGAPILCNDPHLGLNLPSLWYEVQLQTPDMNAYGVSLPGAPGIIIGFNDSLSWGFTNNYRDVKDFYAVNVVQEKYKIRDEYWFEGKKLNYTKRVERIGIKGKKDFIDTVRYTIQGPVIYDQNFHGPNGLEKPLALCWMAHKGTNELLAIYLLNHAKNYPAFMEAIFNFQCPAQNMVYADRAGNIALWGQGQFINKWKDQGRFIMNGGDSATLWKGLIPMQENPHVLNPGQGFVSSANQSVTDSTYPYWYNGYFYEFRAWRINQILGGLQHATVQDMFALQNDTYSILASNVVPVMLRYMQGDNTKYISLLRNWDYHLSAESEAATVFQVWWDFLYKSIWSDELNKLPYSIYPSPERTMQLLVSDSSYKYYDDINTTTVETLRDIVRMSYVATADSLGKLEKTKGLAWYKVKNTTINHLAKLSAFSFSQQNIGGWGNTVNAAKGDHGPSWRMVVQMGKEIEAYGVYPGGQSGNPGSQYYATFIPQWAQGKYYRLLFLANSNTQTEKNIQYTWNIQPK